MSTQRTAITSGLVLLATVAGSLPARADDHGRRDFGATVEHLLHKQSARLFGVSRPLQETATPDIAREPGQTADDLMFLAGGLQAEIFSRDVAHKWDMMAFWPSAEAPTHLVACIEEFNRQQIGSYPGGLPKYNPSVQTIDLETREVRTVLRGLSGCDGIRRTPWGTILVTEEDGRSSGDGHFGGAYEILDPLAFEEGNLVARQASNVIDPQGNAIVDQVAYRPALPTMSWEGLTVSEAGVVIAGDELRPGDWDLAGDGGDDPDVDGGAIFKFVPAAPHAGGPIDSLQQSPLVAGNVYAMRVSCREGSSRSFTVNHGQGCEVGNASWVAVRAAEARRDANNNGATGYYRPEDLHADPTYTGEGIRFCWANTGREAAHHYGEVICGTDQAPLQAAADQATVTVNRFIEGDRDFNSVDNLAFQPHSGNLYVIEDHANGDVWACLPDGTDTNIKSDGCVKILRLKDQSAEPTGFLFSADGSTAFFNIQHSDDRNMPAVDDWGTDDLIKVTGFRLPHRQRH